MISIIICSVNHVLFLSLAENVSATIGVEYEIIRLDNTENKYSLAQAYNLGAEQARYDHICFIHEDVLFKTEGWGLNLINHFIDKTISLVGVLGSVIKTKATSGVYIAESNFNRINQLQRTTTVTTDHYYENPYKETTSEVAILDGLFLATTKANHKNYKFDEELLSGFHGYDVDYSLGQAANGKVVVVYNILLEHLSYGGNTLRWVQEQLKVTKKWAKVLPKHVGLNADDITKAEIKNTQTFLNTLYNLNYRKSLQLKLLLQLIRMAPFNGTILYYMRRLLIYGALEKQLKAVFK